MTPENQEERRLHNELLMEMVRETRDSTAALDAKLTKHMIEEPRDWAAAISDLMKSSFPEGDPDGHRKHHEAVIKAAEEKAEFWKKMRMELVQKGLIGFGLWALYALWVALLHGPAK